ncbi:acyl-CoA dehydrogenase family protein [Streptomyces turgidiscabies]|uniref:Acyl-CoA dehydrogenase, C-terminal domain protein n=1 Tax=Streptomyces turgidiscabies (strain Car8) TaxID=698760 RepID=L7FCG8_STRT8|nr:MULTISPECIES: acyl-CoA dehydrogenase family protein [Streptomyces]ELP69253.1 acyl-CoA dehydrogenase, C-terminal domain protein [Streptomyces turgidiscabies Car8]MDX3493129.1 acyl-CoA/acyl-ACP dehydrogenase [Streptomyces turgidiscabies]GAQ70426.1 acyl-CoA dehydrogenase [Streptomyces turgidiscabies]
MDARFTPEQDHIRRTLRELLHKRCAPGDVRAAVDTPAGYDPALWTTLAGDLGLPGLALPEAHGGVGGTTTELALAAEELGRTLAPSPLLATAVLAAPLITALGTPAQRADLLPRIASGALTATLAVPGTALAAVLSLNGEPDRDWAGGGRAGGVQAARKDTGWRLYGQVGQVLDGHSAGLLLVAAHAGGYARSRTLLFLVPGDAPGLVRTRQTSIDATRPQARLELRDVPAELLGEEEGVGGDAGADLALSLTNALALTGDVTATVLAAEAVGAADRILELTVEHALHRVQFGRAIGSFQAVKHRLADVYVQVQAARSAAYYAAWATAHEGERVGGLALAQALDSLRTATAEGIQLHGGIGFTWEHEAQLYFKRAAGDELLFGPVHRLRAHAADAARLFDTGEVTV